MRLSFILPCYNVERYISECLDSLFRQDIPVSDYEVICVNDCSTDKTRDIILTYQRKYDNIILIDHKFNQTAGGARNTGLDAAKGTYVWFVDPDDMLVDNVAGTLLDNADWKELDIMLFNYRVINESENVLSEGENVYENSVVLDGYSFLDRYFNKNIGRNSIVWCQLYRRALLENSVLRYPLLRVSQDAIFSWKALFVAKRVQSESICRYIYRVNSSSTTHSKPTAEKVFTNSVLAQYELHKWITSGEVRTDYATEIQKAISYDYGRLFSDYNRLTVSEKRKLYGLLRDKMDVLRVLAAYGGRKKNIARVCLYFGNYVFFVISKLLFE